MSQFAKRHYEAIARAMQNLHPGGDIDAIDYDSRLQMWHDTVLELSIMFRGDNGIFQADRFGFACNPGSNVKAKTTHLKAVRS